MSLIFFRYFVSIVLQFQLFQSLCEISGHTGELHACDLYRSREAGRLLSYVNVHENTDKINSVNY